RAGAWRWDAAKIAAKEYTSNVVEFLVARVEGQPARTRRVLELAACIGGDVDTRMLAALDGRTEEEVHEDLLGIAREGLLLRAGHSYRFAHDRVRQAVYLLVGEDE